MTSPVTPLARKKTGMLRGAFLPAASLILLLFMVVPLPAFMLDMGFIANIMISLAVLMVALNVHRALDFSAFPTVLLFATLLRLALNVASTRVVLMHGHEGSDAAGHVIEAFGAILVGGDYVVGLFVFAILLVINLVVITKGAGRVSEVSARFTLDALPGKQMAIDADLNAGLISADDARTRRADVATEADFYGSMDGASKFVKGDAIAGLLILAINIFGGIILGVVSHGLALSAAAQTYVLLAIGDALVAQVPALLLSIAAAAIVTRVTSTQDLPGQLGTQFGAAEHWLPVAAILLLLGLVPGMPHLMLLLFAAGAAAIGWLSARAKATRIAVENRPVPAAVTNPALIAWDDISDHAAITIDIGFALVPLVDDRKGAPLMQRITGIRRQLSRRLGFVIPLVRVRDDMAIDPNLYRISINGIALAEDHIFPNDLLALATGDVTEAATAGLAGRPAQDPSFGLDALWIAPNKRPDAIIAGYTVVDPATVIVTHVNQLLVRHADQLFGLDDAKALADALKPVAPQLTDALLALPNALAVLCAVCRCLLCEGIAIRDFRPIAEAMVQAAGSTDASASPASIDVIVQAVRRAIGGTIVQAIVPHSMPLPVLTFAPDLESLIADAVRIGAGPGALAGAAAGPNAGAAFPIDPALSARIIDALRDGMAQAMASHGTAALITAPMSRAPLARLVRAHLPNLAVLSYLELPESKAVEVVAVVGNDSTTAHPTAQPRALSNAGALSEIPVSTNESPLP